MVASSRRPVPLTLLLLAAGLVVGAGCSGGHVAGGGGVECDANKPNFGCGVGSQCIDQRCVVVGAGCSDRLQDGVETGVDCGGSCQSCDSRCADRVQDGDEAGVDCGGSCAACATGANCATGTDCASGACVNNVCLAAATCTDGVRDGTETAVDCGGSCPGCADGLGCGANADCQHGVCSDGLCRAATCADGVLDGFETGVDCGGGLCPACAGGVACIFASDCTSGVCAAGVCQAPSCSDGVQNGAETAIDCGGTCGACANGEGCVLDSDCQSNTCVRGVCATPDCTTTCGGSCPACPVGGACTGGAQCQSGVCVSGSCRAPTCSDGVKNGDETGTDCGGGICGACASGGGCAVASDCQSGLCSTTTHVCQAAAGGVASLSVVVSPAPVYSCKPATLVVIALDASGNIVRGYTGKVHFTSTATSVVLPADYTFVAGDLGVHRFVNGITLSSVGSQSVTARDQATPTAMTGSATVDVLAPIVGSLELTGIASSVRAGTANTVTVTARDTCGAVATGYAGAVAFTSSDPKALPGAGLPQTYTFTTSDAGAHTFTGGVMLVTAGTQSVTVQDTADATLAGTQSGIVVTPVAATALQVSGIDSPFSDCATSGVTVVAVDTWGNTDPTFNGTVAFTSSDPQASLPANYTFTGAAGDAGVHSFAGELVLRTVGPQTVTVTDAQFGTITGSQSVDVVPGAATTLAISVITNPATSNPTATVAGVACNVLITARDACGSMATDYKGTVGFTSSDPKAVLPGPYTFLAADLGAHTLTGALTLETVGLQSVTVTDAADATLTAKQLNIQVRPGAAVSLVVSGIGSPIAPSTPSTITVLALDAFGNDATDYTGTIKFTSSDGAATLPANYTFVAGDKGTHTFTSEVLLQTVGTQSVTATDLATASITGSQTGIDVNANGCGKRTCANTSTTCGPISDGCGGIIQCGTCSVVDSCQKCQDPRVASSCVPGSNSCGAGCGGGQTCTTCSVAETCGGGGTAGACGATTCCMPKTQCPVGANCGIAADGCGGFINCCATPPCATAGACTGTDTCGGAGTPNVCGTGTPCVAKTSCSTGANCGQESDGCGGVVNCCATPPCATAGTCTSPDTCGGGGTANVCGVSCTPTTCAAAGANCGLIGDGCGGTLNCGTCTAPQTCGGGGTASVCGCTGLLCQQVACSGSATTTITGKVYAATPPSYWPTGGGPDPLHNALVYIPNAALDAFTPGVTCSQCSAQVSGSPLMWANTTTAGAFTLSNVPVGTNIPLVIQFGYWRRKITIPNVAQCVENALPSPSACAAFTTQTACQAGNCAWNTAVTPSCETLTRLPRTKAEGDMPAIALSSGSADAVECVLPKIGIDPSEFTPPGFGGRVNFFRDNGATLGNWTCSAGTCGTSTCTKKTCAQLGYNCGKTGDGCGGTLSCGSCSVSGQTCGGGGKPGVCGAGTCTKDTNACTTKGLTCGYTDDRCGGLLACNSNSSAGCTPPASNLYNSLTTLQQYNMVIWDCVGSQVNKTAAQQKNVMDYVNSGGRMFATHYGYVWLYDDPPFGCTTPVDCTGPGNCNAACTTTGQTTAFWMPQQSAPPDQAACLVTDPKQNPEGANFSQWLTNVNSIGSGMTTGCGAQPYISVQNLRWDANMPGTGQTWPPTSQLWAYTNTTDGGGTLWNTPVEFTFNTPVNAAPANQCGRVLFSDFHVYNTAGSKFPSSCKVGPLTPQEKILEYMIFDLSNCVSTTPDCVPKTCPANSCGPIADGCGGLMNGGSCGSCPTGQTCGGGGTPSVCGTPTSCTPNPNACVGVQCGYVSDGCGNAVQCNVCPPGQSCSANVCSGATCTPITACPAGYNCGTISDGCGGFVQCGTCTLPQTCGGGGTSNVCGAPCTPSTCQSLGATCGQLGDGCGGVLNCGTCPTGQTCGAVTPNQCGAQCSSSTCSIDADCCSPLKCNFGICSLQ